ncbi:MAG: hypothetical protein ACYDEX_16780 [Mobilitalea sp.]
MFRINGQINAEEIVLFKLRKKKWAIPLTLMISPLFLLVALIFNMFAESDKIMIKAKKGSLGFVYDKWFYTQ